MRAILGCALAVALVVNAGLVGQDKKDEKIDAKKLVGKWEPKDKKKDVTIVLEFTKDGKLIVTAAGDGKEAKFDGTYKVDGNKLITTLKFGEKEQSETHTVTKLTDTELVSKDEKGKEETLVRVKK